MADNGTVTDHLAIWNALRTPPADALKKIEGGRLAGKTDINAQWRLEAVTEQFGPVGVGWKFEVAQLWTEPCPNGEIMALARVDVYVRPGDSAPEWSAPIPGVGGSMLVANEKKGPYADDNAFKKAVTDALGTALRTLGVAADVYRGMFDAGRPRQQQGQRGGSERRTEQEGKADGLRWIKKRLEHHFPETPDNGHYAVRGSALKDVYGVGAWTEISKLTVDQLREGARPVSWDENLTRLDLTCRLVGGGVRRSETIDPAEWPTREVWEEFLTKRENPVDTSAESS